MARIDIGIIGCGNISHAYLKGAARSELVKVKAVADLRMEAAQAKAAEYGVLSFASGASVSITTSWDVWRHRRVPIELYGSEGSMLVPDPNFFGGEPMVTKRDGDWTPLDISAHPFGQPTRYTQAGVPVADYRMVGVLDLAAAIRDHRRHRASGELAMHVLEVLDALERSSIEGRHLMIETTCERPDPLPLGQGEEVFASCGR